MKTEVAVSGLKTLLVVLAAQALAACGVDVAQRPLGASHCELSAGAFWIYSESAGLKCDAAQANLDLALQMMADEGLASNEELLAVFGGTTIEAKPVSKFWHDGALVYGFYNSRTRTMGLSADGGSLLHELLHSWEEATGVENTEDHPSWAAKDYTSMDVFFGALCKPLF